MTEIREATPHDFDAMWPIMRDVVEASDAYPQSPYLWKEDGYAYWFNPEVTSFVATHDGRVAGMYRLHANQPDFGSHVASAAFMVAASSRRQGVGEALGRHCLSRAHAGGFEAMQFNLVVSTNEAAVQLWKKLGFSIVGTLPGAFRHHRLGKVDAYIMYQILEQTRKSDALDHFDSECQQDLRRRLSGAREYQS